MRVSGGCAARLSAGDAQVLTPNSSAWAGVRFLDDGREEIRRSCTSTEDCRERRPQRVFPAYRAAGPAKA